MSVVPGASPYFTDIIETEVELREVMGEPGGLALGKQLDRLDRHCRQFVALSPFVLVGTSNASGAFDVSPRGDEPGFVLVLDEKTLVIPERPGNRRLDSLLNVLETGSVGLLFLVSGFRGNAQGQRPRERGEGRRRSGTDRLPREAPAGGHSGGGLGVFSALRQGLQTLAALAGGGMAGALGDAVSGADAPRPGGGTGRERG
jgi:predicted pyridoxine 5'-phosphate oxidase superfamily flavin-nucleotide-binding protein